MSGILLPDFSRLTVHWKIDNGVTIFQHDIIVIFFFDAVLFLLFSGLVTGPSFMSLSSLVLQLWQLIFTRNWPKIRKSEIPPSKFCPIPGDWGELWMPNLARLSLIKCYWVLQNARVTVLNVSELLRENQLGEIKLPPPRLELNHTHWDTLFVALLLWLHVWSLHM